MITLSYKGINVGSYTGEDVSKFFSALCSSYIYQMHSEQKKPIPEIISTESFEVRKLKYFAQYSLLLRLLETHPEYLQKILELDHMKIQKVGFQEYEEYLDSLTEENTIIFSANNSKFVKKFDLELLLTIHKSLQELLVNEQYVLEKNEFDSVWHKIACRKLVETLPNFIERFGASLQKIQEIKTSHISTF